MVFTVLSAFSFLYCFRSMQAQREPSASGLRKDRRARGDGSHHQWVEDEVNQHGEDPRDEERDEVGAQGSQEPLLGQSATTLVMTIKPPRVNQTFSVAEIVDKVNDSHPPQFEGSQSRKRQRDCWVTCHYCQQEGHIRANCPRLRSQSKSKPDPTPLCSHTPENTSVNSGGLPSHSSRLQFKCHYCRQEGHIRAKCPQLKSKSRLRPPPPPHLRDQGACYECGELGHKARHCPQRRVSLRKASSIQ